MPESPRTLGFPSGIFLSGLSQRAGTSRWLACFLLQVAARCVILHQNSLFVHANVHRATELTPRPFSPATRRCVSSFRAITYYPSSERTKHKMRGRSCRHANNGVRVHAHAKEALPLLPHLRPGPPLKLPDVSEESDHGIPVPHHHLLGAKLPGRLQQQR